MSNIKHLLNDLKHVIDLFILLFILSFQVQISNVKQSDPGFPNVNTLWFSLYEKTNKIIKFCVFEGFLAPNLQISCCL